MWNRDDVRIESGLACLWLANKVRRVPGLFWLAVRLVEAAVRLFPDEFRKMAEVKRQWERAREAREAQEREVA